MKDKLAEVLVCGLGTLVLGCTSGSGDKVDAAADTRADVQVRGADVALDTPSVYRILDYPALDPKGTYGGKSNAEWLVAWWKHYLELRDATGINADAYCTLAQFVGSKDAGAGNDVFFPGGFANGKVTRSCEIPLGEMIYLPMYVTFADNAGNSGESASDDRLKAGVTAGIDSVTGLSLEIDGKSYASTVSDFAAYMVGPTQFSYTVPDTPNNLISELGWAGTSSFSGAVAKSFCGGYGVLLAPLDAGSHTIRAVLTIGNAVNDYTFNLIVRDTLSPRATDGGGTDDAAQPVNYCTGSASGAVIDNMTGPNISLAPPTCGSPGAWTAWSVAPGILTTPAGDSSVLSNCGSFCQPLYSPLPAGFPQTLESLDAGAVDGGAAGPQAMCTAGSTSPNQFAWSGMTLAFAFSGTPSRTGPTKISSPSLAFTTDPPPALIDASRYSGIEFWIWASPNTAAPMSAGFVAQLIDKNQLPGGGVCDANATTGKKPCHAASAGISFSSVAVSEGTGSLLGADGFELTALAPGWQLVRAPWSSFRANPYYGGGNEKSVDPTSLAFAQFVIEQTVANAAPIPFDFCVYGLRFYP